MDVSNVQTCDIKHIKYIIINSNNGVESRWSSNVLGPTGVRAEDFLQTTMIPLEKKSNARACKYHLLTHALKHVFKDYDTNSNKDRTGKGQKQLTAWVTISLDSEGGIGTRDATGVLRVLIERSCQQGQDMYMFCGL